MSESEYIHKSHNVSVLLYYFVCPAKYRKVVFSKAIDMTIKEICLEIEKRYDVHFLEIGTDKDHVHFLVQSVPTKSASEIIRMVKSITAREVFKKHPEVKEKLWGGNSGRMDFLSTRSASLVMKRVSRNIFVIKACRGFFSVFSCWVSKINELLCVSCFLFFSSFTFHKYQQ